MRTLTLACVVIALALSACASDNDTSTAAVATTTTTAAQPTTSTAEPVTTTTVAETTTTAAEDTTTTTTEQPLGRLPYDTALTEPGDYAAQAGLTHFQLTLVSPAIVETGYGAILVWPEPLPAWMEANMDWEGAEEGDGPYVPYQDPILVVYPATSLYPDGEIDSKVPAAEIDDLVAFLADHPGLANPSEPTSVLIGGQEGVRIETGFVGDFGECGVEEFGGAVFVCTLGVSDGWVNQGIPDIPTLDPEQRFRIDLIPVGDKVVLLQTRLYPDAEDESKAMADAIIEGIEFPTA